MRAFGPKGYFLFIPILYTNGAIFVRLSPTTLMELNKKDKLLIEETLNTWEKDGNLSSEKVNELKSTITQQKAGGQIAKYFFLIAIASTLLAFGAIFIDDKLLEQIKRYFDVSNLIIAISCTIISILWFGYLLKRRSRINAMVFEVYTVLGALTSICAVTYYCKDIGFGDEYTGFLFANFLLLLTLSIILRSYALWLGTILAIMGWYGAFSHSLNNLNNKFLGMNYPFRFTAFGLIILAFSYVQTKIKPLQYASRQTYVFGLLIFFTALWGVSVFGNYGQYNEWLKVRQVQVIGYSVVLAVFSVGALLLGIKYEDDITRDFGIIFILLNLYSRYFEFFWNTTNKGIFFLILAISFGIIGWQIEKRVKRNRAMN